MPGRFRLQRRPNRSSNASTSSRSAARWRLPRRPIRARLRNEMAQLRPGRFSWDARNLGGNRWTIRLERIDENADGESFLTYVPAFTAAKGKHHQRTRRAAERAQLHAG